MVGKEPPEEEKIRVVKEFLEQKGGTAGYKEIQTHCEDMFEGVRLLLKKMKSMGILQYEGMMPMFDSVISLT